MGEDKVRQFVKYSFYKLDRRWRLLSSEEQAKGKEEFLAFWMNSPIRCSFRPTAP